MTARRLALGVDLGGTNARAAVVDASSGELVAAHKETLRDRTPAAVVRVVAGALDQAARAAGFSVREAGSVGVGVAGQCLGRTGVVHNAPNLGWRNVAFGDLLGAALGVKVIIGNDLAMAAWGERSFGAARGIDDVVLVFLGSGVGCGLILGGRVHSGATGVAAEFGHIKVRPGRASTRPRICGCGETSCLEAYTSGMNVAARLREDIAAGGAKRIMELAGGDLARVGAPLVEVAAREGDPYARELWEEVGELLGTAIANLITLLNPARLILGGGVLLGSPTLADLVRSRMDAQMARAAASALTVERAGLGDDAGVVGAALLDR